jgi:hypothetical protein
MITHDFSTPIPPGTIRISVIWNDHLHTADMLTAKLPNAILAFEQFAGLVLSAANADEVENAYMAAATVAAVVGDDHVVTTAALWRFLFDPAASAMNTERLSGILNANGSALLAATMDIPGAGWRFQLFAMPRWPVSVRPTNPDVQRRRR